MTDGPHHPAAVPALVAIPNLPAALQRYREGAYDEAAELLAAVLALTPDDPTALSLRGLALARSGRVKEGVPLLARAAALTPTDPITTLHYGIGLQAAGRFAEAAELFRAAMPLMPTDPAPALNLASALLELGEIEDARIAARDALALAPSLAEALYTLGLAEMAARAFTAARDKFAEAVRLNPRLTQGWINLGLARYQLGDVWGATVATNRALAIEPKNNLADANLAVFLALRGEQEEAIGRLRTILSRDPECVSARVNLGSQLVIDREPAQALEVLAGAPPGGRLGVHWRAQRVSALLNLGRRLEARAELEAIAEPLGDAEILVVWRRLIFAAAARDRARMDKLAKRLAVLADDETEALIEHRIIAHFDLARFYSSSRARARAVEHWRRGHRLIALSQPFSREEYGAFFAASTESYDRARLQEGPRANNRDMTPLFIVGLPRSGTTLMEQILSAHPAVHGAGERSDLYNCIRELAGPALKAESARKTAAFTNSTLSVAARKYLVDLHKLAPGARYVADKMPGNALHLGFIATLLPRARIIVCERDPRDIGLSIFQFRFFGYHPYAHDLADLGWYIGQHRKLMDHWHAVLPLPILSVELNDWVDDFKGTLVRVLEFLKLPYDEACENFHLQERKVRTASVDQVRKPVNARGIGRWRAFAEQLEPLFDELDRAGALPETVADTRLRAAALSRAYRPMAAFRVLEKTLTRTPGTASQLADMAVFRLETGEHAAARALAEKAVVLAPEDPLTQRVLCNVLVYSPGVSGAELSTALRRCGALYPRGEVTSDFPPPGKRLRVGLLGLFHRSPVTALTLAALDAIDRERFEIVCFSTGGNDDSITARYRVLGPFHALGHLDDAAIANRIRAERIDILIELSGYLRDGRLGVLARRPAPVQIKWAGAQFHTTGIAEVDFIITDARQTPPQLAPLYGERLLVMPGSYACWTPPEEAPEPVAPPLERNGFVTFGSFNSLMKITAPTIAAWSAILTRVPGSRLLLAAPALGEPETADRLRATFESHGVTRDRLQTRGLMPQHELLSAYGEIDIALSPFPYNAGVTLLEGLWMGAPAVALSGESFASRHGASHLAVVGLADWAVDSEEAYVERAVAAAADTAALARLRNELRATLRASAVCDAPAFARALETALERVANERAKAAPHSSKKARTKRLQK
jgi:predicted O-linked N-acetylglucosamine transferase (SPINDLY family)/tetratricopeptide (TPR) repeat protein